MICGAFSYEFCQNSTLSPLHLCTSLLQLWWLSQDVGPGFEPVLVLDFFCLPVNRSWVRTSPSPSLKITIAQEDSQ